MIDLTIFPNPASTILSVQSDVTIELIQIFDLKGMLVQTESSSIFSIEKLAEGMYILQISSDKRIVSKRFVKN